MNKTYRQIYKQQQQVECGLANHWGYSVRKTSVDKKSRREGEAPISVLRNINLRKFGKEIPKTDQILKIQEELQALQTERVLMRITEEAASRGYIEESTSEEKSPIIKMMEGKIQEYNYIVDHKHLIDRGSDETRKILKMQAKSDMERVLEKIKGARERLLAGDMNSQIMLNREMAKLYRSYREKMDVSPRNSLEEFQSKTMRPEPAKSGHSNGKKDYFLKGLEEGRRRQSNDLSYRTYINNSPSNHNLFDQSGYDRNNNHTEGSVRNGEGKGKEGQFYKYDSNKPKHRKRIESFNNQQISKEVLLNTLQPLQNRTIDPYIGKKQVMKYREMERKIRCNSQALQLIKSKLANVRNKSSLSRRQGQEEQEQQRVRQPTTHSVIAKHRTPPVLISTSRKEINRAAYALTQLRQHEKEEILAGILKRKHNKFNKIGGNRMIVKYDQHRVAKDMLEGDGSRDKPKSKEEELVSPKNSARAAVSFQGSPRVLPDELSYLAEQNNDEHYWRMCRNEKINLLFKKR